MLLDVKTRINCLIRQKSHGRCCRWCILLAHPFEFFFVFNCANVVHFSQFVQLSQGQMSFAQVTQLWLAVVLRHVLIGFRLFVPKFLQYHTVIYAAGGVAAGGMPPPPGATPGAPGAPRSPPAAPAGSIAPIS